MKKIAILLSTYNGSKYLSKQLESIAAQKVSADLIMLVRDDGSSDSTLDILNQWKIKINMTILEDKKSYGPAKSFWNLLQLAPDSDYYAFVDQDDVWDFNKLDTAINALNEYNGPALWCSNSRIINAEDEIMKEFRYETTPVFSIASQMICGSMQGCSMVFNRAVVDYLLSKTITEIPMHDLVVMTYILACGKIIYDSSPLFSYRAHESNAVDQHGKKKTQVLKEKFNLWFGKEHKNSMINFIREYIANNGDLLDNDTYSFLQDILKSKTNLVYRCKVIQNNLVESNYRPALRSFKVRIMLGLY